MEPIGYVQPRSLAEACRLLARYGDEARPIAGGTVLVLVMNKRLYRPRYLIDLAGIENLNRIENDRQGMKIGCLVTHRALEKSLSVRKQLPALAEMAATVANPQIRNMGTIGGCLAYGEAACDPPAALISLGAKARIIGSQGERRVAVEDLITGFYETCLEPDELIAEFEIPPLPPRSGAAYQRFSSTVYEDKPLLGVAAKVTLDDGGRCYDLRLGLGAVAATPVRPARAEELAKGKTLTEDLIEEIVEAATGDVDFISDIKGSSQYRQEMCRLHLRKTIQAALQRAKCSPGNKFHEEHEGSRRP